MKNTATSRAKLRGNRMSVRQCDDQVPGSKHHVVTGHRAVGECGTPDGVNGVRARPDYVAISYRHNLVGRRVVYAGGAHGLRLEHFGKCRRAEHGARGAENGNTREFDLSR